eukprot:gene2412-2781_t
MADAWKKIKEGVKAKRTNTAVPNNVQRRPKGEELTVQRLSADVSGKAQKYTRMGRREFVPFGEDIEFSLENIKRACEKHFVQKLGKDIECDVVASEQGPSCKSINQLPDGKVIYVRFIPKTAKPKPASSSFDDSRFSVVGFSSTDESIQRKRVHETDLHNHASDSKKLGTIIPISERSHVPPRSLTVSDMLKLGRLRKDTFSTVIDVFEFDMKLLSWNQVPKIVEFIEDKKCLGSGGFRKAYKATSNHPAFLGSTWVVKRYLTEAKTCISETGQNHLKSALNPPTLDLSVDRYAAWTIWRQKWNDYSLLAKLSAQPKEYQCALLRYTFTDETRNVYESLNLSTDNTNDPNKILDALDTFSRGVVNETLERHLFNSRKQDDGEKFDDFLTDLKILSKNCNFCHICYPGLLRSRIVGGIQDDKIRHSLLVDNKLTLEKAKHLCRAGEKAVEGRSTLKGNNKIKEDEVSFVASRGPKRQGKKQFSSLPPNAATKWRPTSAKTCKFCLRTHVFGRNNCPAAGKRCNTYQQFNHFAGSSVCPQTSVSEVEKNALEVENLFLGRVDLASKEKAKNATENDWQVQMKTTGGSILFKVDTGADVTVIGQQHLPQFDVSREDIHKTRKSLRGPANQQLHCLGYIKANLSWGKKTAPQIIYICKNIANCLLGKPAIKALDMLRFSTESELSCCSVDSQEGQDILNAFPEVFEGLGNIKGAPIHIKIQEDATPYHLSTPCHVALPLLDPLKKELSRMEEMGVIRRVEEHTEWCHPIVLVKNDNGSIRLCLDLTRLNIAVKREFYQLESVDETLAKLGECKILTKLDANLGYWQMPLDEESQLKATFITPFGRFCPTRGPFGLSSMQEIFNKRLHNIISGLPGVVKSTDDFLVTGKDMAEHDERLRALLKRLSDNGVTLNPTRCKFRQTAVDFLGHNISAAGVRPLSTKVDALLHFRTPGNITELRRFFGMAQQLAKFTPELARASEPLRGLHSTKNSWVWTANHEAALQETKKVLAQAPILAHYDVSKPTKLRTDGSVLNGIAAILYQQHGDQWKPVEFASHYPSEAEKNYHNIEIEMLAVTWGCEKMSKYLHGLHHFVLQTDHKPLIPILNYKPLAEMTPRIQRMHAVIGNAPATEPCIEEIKKETRADASLQELIKMIHKGWPSTIRECPANVHPFWHCRHDMTEPNGLILKGSQIVIPASMRRDMLDRIHEGHLGMEKCKRRARQCIYWPNMNNQIEQKIQRCGECTKLLPSKPTEPLLPHECPEKPSQKVGSDLFPWAGKVYVIIVDYFSLWPEVILRNR